MVHILLVDDEPDVLDALNTVFLEAEPQWNITPEQSVKEAISALSSPGQYSKVDLVLTDLIIENDKAGGIKILEAAKKNDPYTEVILFTANDREIDRTRAY